ncbi:MAG: ATP-binding protein [Chloroflexota bacterium]|nr:ATP-binding protein [Chloroflexota bacterium]
MHKARELAAKASNEGDPLGAYLRSITVEGFRGIGPARRIEVQPGPGLTLVIGRNGSGKSSFAEGLEILLTASNWRWRNRSVVWKQGWRNLHQPSPTSVAGEFAIEGQPGATTITRKWTDGANLEAGDMQVMPATDLGWSTRRHPVGQAGSASCCQRICH